MQHSHVANMPNFKAGKKTFMIKLIPQIAKAALAFLLTWIVTSKPNAQPLNSKEHFGRQDTLRGSIGTGRMGWNVLHYDITVQPDYVSKTIRGKNILKFYDEGAKLMQIDLQEPMIMDSIIANGTSITFSREGNIYWVQYRDPEAMYKIKPGPVAITLYFHGKPREAVRAPWDGGWIWKKDKTGNPWMSVACQGLGASVWFPCKDHQSDEPEEGAALRMIVPDSLTAIGNGRMLSKKALGNGLAEYSWEVKNPINSYNIVPYIGKYVHFGERYNGEKGPLDMDYWVLDYNLEKAKKQFNDAPRMMKAFEHWFGPYPFYEDGYKLVEAPHLGMEHQSSIAYGNGYQNGYLGNDRSGSGWGKKFDFIIIHESGHEWFANNITTKDIADMWVHEGFTSYSETLFTDYYYGHEAGNDYLVGVRRNIANDIPIIGPYGVNKEGSGDMYDKASNMLHIIRQLVNDDEKFRKILRAMNEKYYHQVVTGAEIEDYLAQQTGKKLSAIFDQYLRTIQVPQLDYKIKGSKVQYRWSNCVAGFDMPVKVTTGKNNKKEKWLYPTTEWKTVSIPKKNSSSFKVDRNFYVTSKKS
jgi:aminopeptidase N